MFEQTIVHVTIEKTVLVNYREMEERYGHYFDMIIIYSDPDRYP
jgi:hypothetical protein